MNSNLSTSRHGEKETRSPPHERVGLGVTRKGIVKREMHPGLAKVPQF